MVDKERLYIFHYNVFFSIKEEEESFFFCNLSVVLMLDPKCFLSIIGIPPGPSRPASKHVALFIIVNCSGAECFMSLLLIINKKNIIKIKLSSNCSFVMMSTCNNQSDLVNCFEIMIIIFF